MSIVRRCHELPGPGRVCESVELLRGGHRVWATDTTEGRPGFAGGLRRPSRLRLEHACELRIVNVIGRIGGNSRTPDASRCMSAKRVSGWSATRSATGRDPSPIRSGASGEVAVSAIVAPALPSPSSSHRAPGPPLWCRDHAAASARAVHRSVGRYPVDVVVGRYQRVPI